MVLEKKLSIKNTGILKYKLWYMIAG